jgi:hypothetical protein
MKVMYGIMLFFLGGSLSLYFVLAESRCSVVYLICFFLQVASAIVYLILLHKEKKVCKTNFFKGMTNKFCYTKLSS